jgi:hypothetical protein
MLKNVIAPIQAWLMSQGKCVGCGMPLDKGKKSKGKKGLELVTCKCGRVYVFDSKKKSYRRALHTEI